MLDDAALLIVEKLVQNIHLAHQYKWLMMCTSSHPAIQPLALSLYGRERKSNRAWTNTQRNTSPKQKLKTGLYQKIDVGVRQGRLECELYAQQEHVNYCFLPLLLLRQWIMLRFSGRFVGWVFWLLR